MNVVEVDDDDDELEPLFSYKRVCRPPSDDDSDDDVTIIGSKPGQHVTKLAGSSLPPVSKAENPPCDKIDIEDDNDWLPPPPPKIPRMSSAVEDPIVVQMRQKREELKLLTAASEASLKKLEEDMKGHGPGSNLDTSEGPQEQDATPKREKVQVSIQNKDGACKAFKLYMDEKFEKLFATYADSISKARESLVFSFDGQQISGDKTPKSLGIENEDIIEVNQRS